MNPFNKKPDKKPETPPTPPSKFDLKPHIEAVESLWKGKEEEEKGVVKKGKARSETKPETPSPSNFDLKPHIEAVESLWKDKKEEGKGVVKTLKEIWTGEEEKRGYEIPFVKRTKKEKSWIQKVKSMDFGPGGAVGVGCGVGVGVGLVGGVGLSENPWNHLKFVIGFGAGCGIGIGYGFGHGLGYFWDRRPPQEPKRKVIEF